MVVGERVPGAVVGRHSLAVSTSTVTVEMSNLRPTAFSLLLRGSKFQVPLEIIEEQRSYSQGTATVTAM